VQGLRPNNEDQHVCVSTLPTNPDYAYFAVYDGHDGTQAAEAVGLRLHVLLDEEMSKLAQSQPGEPLNLAQLHYSLVRAFCVMDDEFINKRLDSGSTVAVLLVDRKRRLIISANAGDSRSIAARVNGRTETLSRDHKPDGKEEQARIEEAKHEVVEGRLDDTLSCRCAIFPNYVLCLYLTSRAIGDVVLKLKDKNLVAAKKALSPYPYMKDFLFLSCIAVEEKVRLRALVKELERKSAETNKIYKQEQRAAHAVWLEEHKKLEEERQRQKEAELIRKQECEAKGEEYVRVRNRFVYETRFFCPSPDVPNPRLMVIDDDDMDEPVPSPTTKKYQFSIVACDGLYDVMSNREVTQWVNTQLQQRALVNQTRLEQALARQGLTADGRNIPFSTTSFPPLTFQPLSDIPKDLCQLALDKKSTDNVSVVFIMLEPELREWTTEEIASKVRQIQSLHSRRGSVQAKTRTRNKSKAKHKKSKSLFGRW
jgi:serine/threonine protein phosphatase PrpC